MQLKFIAVSPPIFALPKTCALLRIKTASDTCALSCINALSQIRADPSIFAFPNTSASSYIFALSNTLALPPIFALLLAQQFPFSDRLNILSTNPPKLPFLTHQNLLRL